MTAPPRTRKSAEQRRAEIVQIAVEHFALGGYNGTSTDAVAREAGISQPYLFRLFKTKRDLFLACHDRQHERLYETFRAAAAAAPQGERLAAMGIAYTALLEDRHALLFQIQSYAASSDPVIQARVRAQLRRAREARHARLGRRAGRRVAVLLARDAAQRRGRARPARHRRATSPGPSRGARPPT